jgi:methionine synthase II (cobalamin-independent)
LAPTSRSEDLCICHLSLQLLSGVFPDRIGSLNRTRSHITFRLDGALLQEALDDATLLILKRQEEIGLDLLTDGEQRRHHFISNVLAAWDASTPSISVSQTTTAALCSNGACPV